MPQPAAVLPHASPDYDRTLVLAIELSSKSWVLAAQVPGWKRLEAAEEWLRKNREAQQVAAAERSRFDRFIASNPATKGRMNSLTEDERERLFQDFLKWRGR